VLIPEALLKAAICLGCNDSISRVGTQYSSLKDMTVAEFGGDVCMVEIVSFRFLTRF